MSKKPKLTPWFPPGVNPVRTGVYLATVVRGELFYRHWNGAVWLTGGKTLKAAVREVEWDIATSNQAMHWRGLAKEPK